MKRFTQLMSLLFMAAVTQYSCINDADVAFSDESHTDSDRKSTRLNSSHNA